MEECTILAHNYVRPEVQAMAHFVGDSLELARQATKVRSPCLAIAGVDFMAEMAALINPEKTVIHPEPFSKCAMAARLTPEDILKAKEEYPDAAVVSYVNTSAAVKAVSDITCTSANAVRVVAGLEERQIIFAPDRNLALYVAKRTRKKIISVPAVGCCPVHHALTAEDIRQELARNPDAEVIVHPETPPEVQDIAHFIGSTSQMIRYAAGSPAATIIVGTEVGILTRMRSVAPGKTFVPASPYLVCPDMKMLTVRKLMMAIEKKEPTITLDPDVAEGARRALERMLAVS